MSPSQSGKISTRCCAQAMSCCAVASTRRQRTGVPFALAAQQREVEPGDVDPADLVGRCGRAAVVAVGEGVAEVATGRVGMALDDEDARSCHGSSVAAHDGAVVSARLDPRQRVAAARRDTGSEPAEVP